VFLALLFVIYKIIYQEPKKEEKGQDRVVQRKNPNEVIDPNSGVPDKTSVYLRN